MSAINSRQTDRKVSLSDSGNDKQHNTKIPGVVRVKGKGKKVGSIAFSPKTYEAREELRALGLVPDMSEKTWKGELDIFEQIDLARHGMIALRCECAEGSFAVKTDLKEHGFRWDATRRRWFADLSTEIDWLIGLAAGSKVNIWISGYGIAYYWAEKKKEETPSEPPYEPPLEEVHGFGDETVSEEATSRSRLLARSYEMLSGTDKTEVATLLSSLEVPEDPEAAEIWAQQHRLEAVSSDTHLADARGSSLAANGRWASCSGYSAPLRSETISGSARPQALRRASRRCPTPSRTRSSTGPTWTRTRSPCFAPAATRSGWSTGTETGTTRYSPVVPTTPSNRENPGG
jgi:hypothetical protein